MAASQDQSSPCVDLLYDVQDPMFLMQVVWLQTGISDR